MLGVFLSVPIFGGLLIILGGFLAIGLYLLPTIVGAARKVVNIGSVFAINLLLGWTLIGWAVALAMALRTNPPYAYPHSWQPPRSSPQPTRSPTAPPGWYGDPQGVTRWWDGTQWTATTRLPADAEPGASDSEPQS